ncbi:MAG: hypothetical protein CL942_00125 [Desulfovibrio sp.]|nr:hypothetical protein [Desulfovibrio sp.]
MTDHTIPTGPISRKMFRTGVELKVIADRLVDHPASTDELVQLGNELIANAQQVEGLETAKIIGGPING